MKQNTVTNPNKEATPKAQNRLPLEQKSLHTPFIVGEFFTIAHTHTHISYTTLIVNCRELIYVMHVYLWCLFVLPLLYHRKAITQQ